MRLFFDDPDFDGSLQRAIAYAPYAGADPGECLVTAARVTPGDRDSWWAAFSELAARVREVADHARDAGREVSARAAYLRASNYFRAAEFYVRDRADDPRSLQGWQESHDAFAQALALFATPGEWIEIPYEDRTLPGFLVVPQAFGGPFPTVVSFTGFDGYAEEVWVSIGLEAVARGYAVLIIDGPGQGGVLRRDGVPLRPDWEAVLSPALAFARSRPEVDADRIAVIGRSLGATWHPVAWPAPTGLPRWSPTPVSSTWARLRLRASATPPSASSRATRGPIAPPTPCSTTRRGPSTFAPA